MDNATLVALISGIASMIASIIAAISAYLARRQSLANQGAIQEVHLTMNSRLDQLLSLTEREANAAGRLQGRAELTDEQRHP